MAVNITQGLLTNLIQRNLGRAAHRAEQSFERLSSGERINRAAWPKALRRVWSGTDLGAAAGRMLDAEDLSRLTALAVSDFMSRREKKNEG